VSVVIYDDYFTQASIKDDLVQTWRLKDDFKPITPTQMITLKIATIALGIFLGRKLESDFSITEKLQFLKSNQING